MVTGLSNITRVPEESTEHLRFDLVNRSPMHNYFPQVNPFMNRSKGQQWNICSKWSFQITNFIPKCTISLPVPKSFLLITFSTCRFKLNMSTWEKVIFFSDKENSFLGGDLKKMTFSVTSEMRLAGYPCAWFSSDQNFLRMIPTTF